MRRLLLLLAWTACAVDADGDGWSRDQDCDDANPAIAPGTVEICDLVDQDCDGDVDDLAVDAVVWYRDQDGDGYGNPTRQIYACSAPGVDWSRGAGDCDDFDPAVNPDAVEICDQRDQTCDGLADEGFVCGEAQCDDGIDEDRDGATDCEDPDCDGACPETCGDGRDNDGDGAADCADRACWADDRCVEVGCGDGVDNERDGVADCDDPDCWGTACPDVLFRVTAGSLAIASETTVWAAKDCAGPDCPRGVDRAQEVQEYDVRGEIVRRIGENWVVCPFRWDRGRTFEQRSDDVMEVVVSERDGFIIGEGCGVRDDRFVPRRLVWSDEVLLTLDGRTWMAGDTFESTTRLADLDHPERVGQISRFQVFVDPIRPGQPLGACRAGAPGIAYPDDDGDGFSGHAGVASCEPEGSPDDCADGDPQIPAVEVCADGYDGDCDGSAPCSGPAGVQGLGRLHPLPSGAGLPRPFRAGDLDGDGRTDLLIGAPGEDAGGVDAGAVLAFGGVDLARIGAWSGLAAGDLLGAAVAPVGDYDGDGRADLAAAAPGVVFEETARSGAVYLLAADGSASPLIRGDGEWVGAWLTTADLDRDGTLDVIVGAQTDGTAASQAGSVRAFRGPVPVDSRLDDADWTWLGDARNEIIGDAFAALGDVDGDGEVDVGIGKRKGALEAGTAHLFLGAGTGIRALEDAAAIYTGEVEAAWAGERIAAAGDVDRDGYDDWLVAAPRTWGKAPREVAAYGEVYLLAGGLAPVGGALREARAVLRGDRIFDAFGADVAGDLDLDGDGHPDVLAGAPGDDRGGDQAGAVLAFCGPLAGVLTASDAEGTWRGAAGAQIGGRLAAPGDLDGDGYADFVVSGFQGDTSTFWTVVPGGPGW